MRQKSTIYNLQPHKSLVLLLIKLSSKEVYKILVSSRVSLYQKFTINPDKVTNTMISKSIGMVSILTAAW